MKDLIRKLWRRTVVRYLFVGGSSYVIELSVLLGLVSFASLSVSAATAIAYWIGLLMAFGLQKIVAFQDYRRELRWLTRQGLLFGLLTLWNWFFTVLFVNLWPDDMVVWSRSLALVIMSGWNFIIYKKIIFKPQAQKVKSAARVSRPGPKAETVQFGPWWRRLVVDRLLWWSISLVVIWRLALEVVNQYVGQAVHFQSGLIANLSNWANWDGGWYLSINKFGYGAPTTHDHQANVAFFPAFPTSVEVISNVTHVQPLYVGLVLNIVLTTAITYLIMKLACLFASRYGKAEHARRIAIMSALAFLAYPASFFLVAYYAEAVLVLGVLGAIYCALTKRLWLAVPFLILATASKVTGAIAVAAVGIIVLEQWWRERASLAKLIGRWLICSLGLLGLMAYAVFLHFRTGDALMFYHIEELWGRNTPGFFLTKLIDGYYSHFLERSYFRGVYDLVLYHFMMILPFVVAGIGLLFARAFKTYWPLVLGILAFMIPLSTGMMESLNRYCLVLAPLFPLLFVWLDSKVRPLLLYILIAFSFLAMFGFSYGFFTQTYFAG